MSPDHLTDAEREEVLAGLKKQFGFLPDDQLERAVDGKSIDVSDVKPPHSAIEDVADADTSELAECLAFAEDVYNAAIAAAEAIPNKIGRIIAEVAAKIAYALGKQYCRSEYG